MGTTRHRWNLPRLIGKMRNWCFPTKKKGKKVTYRHRSLLFFCPTAATGCFLSAATRGGKFQQNLWSFLSPMATRRTHQMPPKHLSRGTIQPPPPLSAQTGGVGGKYFFISKHCKHICKQGKTGMLLLIWLREIRVDQMDAMRVRSHCLIS